MHNQLPSEQATPIAEQPPAPVALFVSDVHLADSLPKTAQAFFHFLRAHARHAQQVFLLGDLFEYWAGDDDTASPFHRQTIEELRSIADAGVALFWIAGNRDFLIGDRFARETGATLLPDPFVAIVGNRKVALSHGDAQCTDDTAYMHFRAQVREAGWQKSFLARPLAERKKIIEGLRAESREAQRNKPDEIMDVNPEAIASLFDNTATSLMIHGHTHRPGRHAYQSGEKNRVRYVLPDWDCDTDARRGGWIAMYGDGTVKRFDVDGNEID
jgi:UDP-2,3-diacylglucosamine hydrolase